MSCGKAWVGYYDAAFGCGLGSRIGPLSSDPRATLSLPQ